MSRGPTRSPRSPPVRWRRSPPIVVSGSCPMFTSTPTPAPPSSPTASVCRRRSGTTCCATRHVQIHHIRHWCDGGATESANLISLCRHHHKLHHLGKLAIAGNADLPDGVTFTDAGGRPLAEHARPRPPNGPPPKPDVAYQHPSGERLQPWWTGLGWVHPNALAKRRRESIERSDAIGGVQPIEVGRQRAS